MKRFGNLYEKICDINNIRLAHHNASKGKKYYDEVCLEEQNFIKENKMTVSMYLKNNNSKVISMFRYEVGEGIVKKNENFAAEVMKQING